MNDAELLFLSRLVAHETAAMVAENERRKHDGCSPAYDDSMFYGLDCYKALDAECRRRGLTGGK